ncbi:MAG: hypothetical protein KGJ43_10185, partial [Acidobacteriota bacterium]|nr:hypothetical protein [Acidobacteriota bacterium]
MGANATTLPLADRPLARRGVRGRLTGVRVTLGEPAVLARVALATIVLCTALTVIAAAGRPSFLSAPTRLNYFPGWMAGPFGGLWTGIAGNSALKTLFSGSLVLSFGAYALLVGRARHLSVRSVVAAILVAHLFLLVSPPLALTDVFNYLNYARMEVVHHLNP